MAVRTLKESGRTVRTFVSSGGARVNVTSLATRCFIAYDLPVPSPAIALIRFPVAEAIL